MSDDPRNALAPWPVGYRAWADGAAHVESLLPNPLATGNMLGAYQIEVAPLLAIDVAVADAYAQLGDIHEATGPFLDLHGSWFGERRLGLGDTEYRRIIAGRRVAQLRARTVTAIVATFRALTEATEIRFTKRGYSTIKIEGLVDWNPTAEFERRAGAVLLTAIDPGATFNAILYRSYSARWDTPDGWDAEPWAYSLKNY